MFETLNSLIETVLRESKYDENPYFLALKDRDFERTDFIETQIQFYFAVAFYNRPMAAFAAKIPTPELRLEIIRNIWEEHGEGDVNRIHSKTFLAFLARITGTATSDIAQVIESRALWPEVRAFNTALSGACTLDDYLFAAAVLGIIERMFSDISFWIGTGVTENTWLTREEIIHYNVHQNLDVKHAEDFFNLLKPSWEHSPESRIEIEQGLRLGAYLFNTLYRDLYQSRSKRAHKTSTFT